MARKKIETIIKEAILPYVLTESGKASLTKLISRYPYELLVECINIGILQYLKYDENGVLTKNSVDLFLNKLGGIAYNKTRTPIDQEINHINSICKKTFAYCNDFQANEILTRYMYALKNKGWSDDEIIQDFKTDVKRTIATSNSWSDWISNMEGWIDEINHWSDKDDSSISESGTIIPTALFKEQKTNIQSLCKQINSSYENNLFDCTAVMMRRLLESLLVISYQYNDIEDEIIDKNGWHYTLDKMIKNATQNKTLSLSGNTSKEMALFKDLGNYSAHKIWYNTTQQDIKPHILKYRVIIEELMYKAGLFD